MKGKADISEAMKMSNRFPRSTVFSKLHHLVLKYVEVCTIAKPIEDTIKEQFGKENMYFLMLPCVKFRKERK